MKACSISTIILITRGLNQSISMVLYKEMVECYHFCNRIVICISNLQVITTVRSCFHRGLFSLWYKLTTHNWLVQLNYLFKMPLIVSTFFCLLILIKTTRPTFVRSHRVGGCWLPSFAPIRTFLCRPMKEKKFEAGALIRTADLPCRGVATLTARPPRLS